MRPIAELKAALVTAETQLAAKVAERDAKAAEVNTLGDQANALKAQVDELKLELYDGFYSALSSNPNAEAYADIGAAMDAAAEPSGGG